MKKLYASFLMCSLLFGGWRTAFAQDASLAPQEAPEIFISEVNWAGSSLSLADEWIEISNRTREDVDLGGWILDGAATSGQAFQLDEGIVLESESSLLIANYGSDHDNTTLLVEPNLVTSSLSLSNNSLSLRLIDVNGVVIDDLQDANLNSFGGNSPFASAVRLSDNSWGSSVNSENLEGVQFGTPGIYDYALLDDIDSTPVPDDMTNGNEPDGSSNEACCGCTCEATEVPNDVDGASSEDSSSDSLQDESGSEEDVTTDTGGSEGVGSDRDLSGQSDILLSEFVSDPLDGTEWIELFNPSSDTVILDGMSIEDAAGGRTVLEGEVASEDYFLVTDPSGRLNNGGDSIFLFDLDGNLVDEVVYGESLPAPSRGESAGVLDGGWVVLETPSPEAENIPNVITMTVEDSDDEEGTSGGDGVIEDPDGETTEKEVADEGNDTVTVVSVISSEEALDTVSTDQDNDSDTRAEPDGPGDIVITEVVTVAPGVLAKQKMYVKGYQIYFHKALWPEVLAGDLVRVRGEISDSQGERRIKISAADQLTVLGPEEAPEPLALSGSVLSAEYTGSLFSFEGSIGSRDGRYFVLSGFPDLRIRLPKGVTAQKIPSDSISGFGVLRSNGEGFYLEVFEEDDLVLPAIVSTQLEHSGILDHSRPPGRKKSIAGAGLFTGTLGMLGFWLRKSLILS